MPVLINTIVIVGYFAGTLWLAERVRGRHGDLDEYFLAGRRMPWWSACMSIVGTETSTLTFVGVPAIAYAGNLTFLQVAAGYVVGRFLVGWFLVPAYFAGRVQTAYELLAGRFGGSVQSLASIIFLVSRVLADGVRLFATALVLQALLPMRLEVAVVGVTLVTLVYTVRGGLRAVIWNDALQLVVYVSGAILALAIVLSRLPNGVGAAVAELSAQGKLQWIDLNFDWTSPYLLVSGVIGGAALTMATHGTDQMFVQRLLACGSERDARRAVVTSGILVFGQMALFLLLGSFLFVFYQANPPTVPFATDDQVFPRFIAEQMPVGISGLVIAAVFAAAMSTLSSSMSSIASAATLDLLLRGRSRDTVAALRASRTSTLLAAVALTLVAALAQTWGSVLEAGLTITSITFGSVLGVFLLGTTKTRLREYSVLIAMAAGLVAALFAQSSSLAWTWLTPLGAATTLLVGLALGRIAPAR